VGKNILEVTWYTKRAPSFYTRAPIICSLGAPSQSAFTDQLILTSEY